MKNLKNPSEFLQIYCTGSKGFEAKALRTSKDRTFTESDDRKQHEQKSTSVPRRKTLRLENKRRRSQVRGTKLTAPVRFSDIYKRVGPSGVTYFLEGA
ncbi:hypothetical protein ACFX2I_006210 [Malus domestica]